LAIWDIFKARAGAEQHAQGRISDLRVEKTPDGERWFIGLDTRPGEWFVFEPSPLSPARRRGEQVVITYTGTRETDSPRSVERIAAA